MVTKEIPSATDSTLITSPLLAKNANIPIKLFSDSHTLVWMKHMRRGFEGSLEGT